MEPSKGAAYDSKDIVEFFQRHLPGLWQAKEDHDGRHDVETSVEEESTTPASSAKDKQRESIGK